MADLLVVLNAGSSSLKFSVYRQDRLVFELLVRGQIAGLLRAPKFLAYDAQKRTVGQHEWEPGTQLGHQDAIQYLLEWGQNGPFAGHQVVAVGHRVVHGGLEFTEPVLVDDAILTRLESLAPLAPLHQPHNLSAIRAVADANPEVAQVACFDTSFHSGHETVESVFALPRELTATGIRRYGFHGLSYEYIASRLPEVDPWAGGGRTVVAHLGSGASMCAMHDGRSIASTMGFTALDGLPMGTRCGALDPGVMLYLMDQHGMDALALEKLLYRESGMLGVSGISNDMRVLLESDDPRAAEAVDLFVHRIVRELGSLAAALGGLDSLVFTAGIGANSPEIRERVCRAVAWLGLEFDPDSNATSGPRISRPGSAVSAWVIPTNEELMIARHTQRLISAG